MTLISVRGKTFFLLNRDGMMMRYWFDLTGLEFDSGRYTGSLVKKGFL